MMGHGSEQGVLWQAAANAIGRALRREFEQQETLPERFRLLLAELDAKVRRNEE